MCCHDGWDECDECAVSLLGEDVWEQAVQLPWVGGAAALHQPRDGWIVALKAAMLTRQNMLFLPSVQSDFPLHFTTHTDAFPTSLLAGSDLLWPVHFGFVLGPCSCKGIHYFLPLQPEALLVFSGRPQDCGLLLSVAAAAVPLEHGFLVPTQP